VSATSDTEVRVRLEAAFGNFDPGETFQHERAGILAHAACQSGVAEKLLEALMQRRYVAWRSEKSGLAVYHNFGQAADATRDDGSPRGHGF
jgi:hypothetical protein